MKSQTWLIGSRSWRGLELGLNKPVPETKDRVWLAPREVKAASVTTPAGESEK